MLIRYTGSEPAFEITEEEWARQGVIAPTVRFDSSNSWVIDGGSIPENARTALLQKRNIKALDNKPSPLMRANLDHASFINSARLRGQFDVSNPNWPTSWNTGFVTGKFIGLDGNPLTGSVIFEMTPLTVNVAGQKTVVKPVPLVANLDSNGHFSIELPAPNDPDINPTGWTYKVTDKTGSGAARTWNISVSAGTTQDLMDISPVSSSIGNAVTRGRGITSITVDGTGHFVYNYDDGSTTTGPSMTNVFAPLDTPHFTGSIYLNGAIFTGGGGGALTANSVTSTEIADGAVGTTELANGAVTVGKIDPAYSATLVLNTRSVTAGTGLTGGGTLAADRSLAVAYGTAAGTAAQGNDARLSDTRTPTAGSVTDAAIVAGGLSQASINGLAASLATKATDTLTMHLAGAETVTGNKSFSGTVTIAEPTLSSHAATKNYVDTVVQGLSTKASVRVATATALPANTYNAGVLTATGLGALTVDGVALAVNDRVLVKNEAASANNGIYTVTAAGSGAAAWVLTRSPDMNVATEFPGAYTFVEAGSTLTATGWVVANAGPFTIGTTSVAWTQFNSAASYIAGTGLTLNGNTFSVNYGTTASTAAAGNDSRLSDTRVPTDGTVTTAKIAAGGIAQSSVTGLSTSLAGLAPTTRLLTAGTGLTGGGDLSADRTFSIAANGVTDAMIQAGGLAQGSINGLTTALAGKAADSTVVHLTGSESIAGVKTFSVSPIVPTPTTATQAATKAYVDSAAGGLTLPTQQTLTGTACTPVIHPLTGQTLWTLNGTGLLTMPTKTAMNSFYVRVQQDATGNRAWSIAGTQGVDYVWAGGFAPPNKSVGPNQYDTIYGYSDGGPWQLSFGGFNWS